MIHIEGIGKRYRLGQTVRHDTLREAIMHRTRFGRRSQPTAERRANEDFWALKDVSFDVAEGEVVGIIGRNGAGKSTLLKILSRITPPTEGRIHLRGRVASLLEVGTGFHPDLSGRENIYLNGAILGMQRQEIKRKFDEIVAFAEVEQFLDTPVKRYSSGMYVRLAFSVAAHLEPQILIVDEVLSVGDAEFQKKCLGKMGEVAKGGRTVLFVSHNMAAVQILTTRAVLLSGGRIVESAETEKVVSTYLQRSSDLVSTRNIKSNEPGFSVYEFEFDGKTAKPGFNAPLRFNVSLDLEKVFRPIVVIIEIINSIG
jgi:lipopolysaccharide transport system ATP-binding protein